MWVRHGLDKWHLDCVITSDNHDFLASIDRLGKTLKLIIPHESKEKSFVKDFDSVIALNEHLTKLGLEKLTTDPLA